MLVISTSEVPHCVGLVIESEDKETKKKKKILKQKKKCNEYLVGSEIIEEVYKKKRLNTFLTFYPYTDPCSTSNPS